MSLPPRDDSVSPMTTSPAPSPGHRQPRQRPSILRSASSPQPAGGHVPVRELPLPITTPTQLPGVPAEEAADHLNWERPHRDQSPGGGTSPSTPGPSGDRQAEGANPGNLLNVREEGDDAAPVEPVSPGRRSVQFARTDVMLEAPPQHSRQGSWEDGDAGGRSRSERWMSRLKSTLGSAGAIQPPKSPAPSELAAASTSNSPTTARPHRLPNTLEEEEGSDADVEESGDEGPPRGAGKPKKRKRIQRRLKQLDMFNSPSTPRLNDGVESPRHSRLNSLVRRSTMPNPGEQRGGLSEGEGRDQLAERRRHWARAGTWVGSPHPEASATDDLDTSLARVHGHRRRISNMFSQGGASDGEALQPTRRPFFGADRKATFGAHKWKQVKNTFRLFGGGKKKIDQFDYYKSAELMAELRAVTPAVVMLASMIQRDDRGNRRIPVLLEQLNLRVVDSQPGESGDSDRHSVFTIALEYGSGVSRMRWTVTRSIWEIWQLHLKYKVLQKTELTTQTAMIQRKRPKQPAFPKKLLRIMGVTRKLDTSSDEERTPEPGTNDNIADATAGEATNAEGTASEDERRLPASRKRSRINQFLRRQSSGFDAADGSLPNLRDAAAIRRKNIEKQRTWIEKYLQEMIHWLMFRADSGRLCNFLELSALGVRLAAEGSFHGKECFLHIQSSKGIDFRRVITPQKVIQRHSRKWFLVRQNYIAVAESPATMNIYDVYLVDPTFQIVSKKGKLRQLGAKAKDDKGKAKAFDGSAEEGRKGKSHHTIKLYTAERKIKLFSRNQTLIRQFEESVIEMLKQTEWHQRHRFDSFAPVRRNAFAQWLVDGRDYMWNVSRAISMAQDVIYIHDWWLSPELYMRRPACISQKWRLDRLLQRKAREGVKIFIIIYRNVEQAIPIDSEYTKFSLLNLHDNILVLRSPNQLKKNQFFYAHHEKICIVDHDVAFLGGIDLCFGRWDNPQHPLADDRPTGMEDGDSPRDGDNTQLFPGKDYSNPRVLDFFKLNEPYEEMYDRSKVPRMPWHDVAMQVVGQPARDLTRHFVQRWNYLRRERKPTRPTPFLLPPPDANPSDLEALGLTGTCEVQMLRSAGDWSLGLREGPEHSIQSAYVKLIEESDHFVYMENQFFITSTETLNTRVVNRIGDALVERIIRAHENEEDWRCCILIPLMPGFQNTVDEAEGSSVRLIMQFQYRSICRGPNSIFGRLRSVGIEPEEYIRFFSLRQWDHIGSKNQLVTEQLYIHAKTIIVDDRVALIGSANINERSMLGNRDSEVAAVVRDTDMISSTMAGRPYRVGRFAHTLRMRLMREHMGLDVDEITEEERLEALSAEESFAADMAHIYGEEDEGSVAESLANGTMGHILRPEARHLPRSFNHDVSADEDADRSSVSSAPSSSSNSSNRESPQRDPRVQGNTKHDQDVAGYGPDKWREAHEKGMDSGRDSVVIDGHEVLLRHLDQPGKSGITNGGSSTPSRHLSTKESRDQDPGRGNDKLPPSKIQRQSGDQIGTPHVSQLPLLPVSDDTDIGGPPMRLDDSGKPTNDPINPWAADIQPVSFDKNSMRDPINPAFWDDIWNKAAQNNTKLYRRVFRCMPDSEVNTWKEYHQSDEYAKLFRESMVGQKNDDHDSKSQASQGGTVTAGITAPAAAQAVSQPSEKTHATHNNQDTPQVRVSNENGDVLNEKVSLTEDGHPQESSKPELHLTAEKANGNQNHAPPSSAGGVTAFPSLPGAQGDSPRLEPQRSLDVQKTRDRRATFSSAEKPTPDTSSVNNPYAHGTAKRRRRATTKSSRRGCFPYDLITREEAEELCSMIQGHVVEFPYDWLEAEEKDNHWLYQADLLAPKEI
ncbi:hypothetical protein DL764_007227 [Monosporascus ibericus]|uniref:Phospholipase D1 n=1 Tax=Monosporascus ibericus TaxID=155417 RepID=A0A4Q4T4M4_9PEZI|nr:hypothetical protein DL764_007227 [Monosporascus ibericus]